MSDASPEIALPGGSAFLAGAPHARGEAPAASAVLRRSPEDFVVDEIMPIDLTGEGEHLWLHVEKRGLDTPRVAGALAAHYGVRERDVGYAGLKDRHALTRQWFSLPAPVTAELPAPPSADGFRCLRATRHRRKLRRGTHAGNRFELTLRDFEGERAAADADLARVARDGCPNYFGPQRFGRDDGNLDLGRALLRGHRMRRGTRRGLALSALRSDLFNAVLAARVANGTWNRLLDGEAAALDGSRSVFAVTDAADATLQRRLAEFDIHPSGPLPGRGGDTVAGAAAAFEAEVLAGYREAVSGLARLGVDADRRALRLRPADLTWTWPGPATLRLTFDLPSGAFATTVLREIVAVR
ncbi:tRNA pseudouridine synthase D [Salinisphaera sp. PC39]|uniref:tRNA pseudouridine(13) synthase TruD n=1 Tax=Salinisphaera sp. PC39 TaxID=1304156 RepID=UPI0033409F17